MTMAVAVSTSTNEEVPRYEDVYMPWFVWTLVLAPCFIPCVKQYHVRLTKEGTLSFGYSAGCMQKEVKVSQILTVEVIDKIDPLCEWGGYGVKKELPTWETGYISKKGPGMRISIDEGTGTEKWYTFCCEDPGRLAKLLTGE